ncbi:MAG: hypothetical protein M1276_01615 [Deltaproteobacteria bacterium]|jgi:hypothetical protein|nr:hypothetical protein [Deltaproteobacteria bacterium]
MIKKIKLLKHVIFAIISVTAISYFLYLPSAVFAADGNSLAIPDPCVSNGAPLSILDRPTVSDSSCAVKPGKVVVETGMQDNFYNTDGVKLEQFTYPYAEIRIGLPGDNEIKFFLLTITY